MLTHMEPQDYTWVTPPPIFQLTLKFLHHRKPSLCPLARFIPLIYTHCTCSPLLHLLVRLLPPPVDCDRLESRELPYSYLCRLLGLVDAQGLLEAKEWWSAVCQWSHWAATTCVHLAGWAITHRSKAGTSEPHLACKLFGLAGRKLSTLEFCN